MKFKLKINAEELEALLHVPDHVLIDAIEVDDSEEGNPKLDVRFTDRQTMQKPDVEESFFAENLPITNNPLCGHNIISWSVLYNPPLIKEKDNG